jgi:hypothetical protein
LILIPHIFLAQKSAQKSSLASLIPLGFFFGQVANHGPAAWPKPERRMTELMCEAVIVMADATVG